MKRVDSRIVPAAVALCLWAFSPALLSAQQVNSHGEPPVFDDDPFNPHTVIPDLRVAAIPGGVQLTFTPPRFTDSSYRVKMDSRAITAENFPEPTGTFFGPFAHEGAEGAPQSISIQVALPPGTSHFAVELTSVGTIVGYSNDAFITPDPDTTAPAAPTGLAVMAATTNSITLGWNPPADDAVEVQVSYATMANASAWTPVPVAGGSTWGPAGDGYRIMSASDGFLAGVTYYFTARARDPWLNVSVISSVTNPGGTFASAPAAGIDSPESSSPSGCPGSTPGFGASLPLVLIALGFAQFAIRRS